MYVFDLRPLETAEPADLPNTKEDPPCIAVPFYLYSPRYHHYEQRDRECGDKQVYDQNIRRKQLGLCVPERPE